MNVAAVYEIDPKRLALWIFLKKNVRTILIIEDLKKFCLKFKVLGVEDRSQVCLLCLIVIFLAYEIIHTNEINKCHFLGSKTRRVSCHPLAEAFKYPLAFKMVVKF